MMQVCSRSNCLLDCFDFACQTVFFHFSVYLVHWWGALTATAHIIKLLLLQLQIVPRRDISWYDTIMSDFYIRYISLHRWFSTLVCVLLLFLELVTAMPANNNPIMLLSILKQYSWSIASYPGDGHCLFHSSVSSINSQLPLRTLFDLKDVITIELWALSSFWSYPNQSHEPSAIIYPSQDLCRWFSSHDFINPSHSMWHWYQCPQQTVIDLSPCLTTPHATHLPIASSSTILALTIMVSSPLLPFPCLYLSKFPPPCQELIWS